MTSAHTNGTRISHLHHITLSVSVKTPRSRGYIYTRPRVSLIPFRRDFSRSSLLDDALELELGSDLLELGVEKDMASCSIYATTGPAHNRHSSSLSPRRARAGTLARLASPYARASSVPRRLRPLSLSLSLNIPLCAMSTTELCNSPGAARRHRPYGSISAPCSSSISPCSDYKELLDSTEDYSPLSYSSSKSSNHTPYRSDFDSVASTSSSTSTSSASSPISNSYSPYPSADSKSSLPSSYAASPAHNHSHYPHRILTSNFPSPSTSNTPSSPVSESPASSVYYSAVSTPFSASPFSPPPWSSLPSNSSHSSRWPTPLSSISTTFPPSNTNPKSRSPSPSPILFSGPPFPSPPHRTLFHSTSPPSFSHITPYMAIGDLAFAENGELLEKEGVTHVVSVLREKSHIPSCIPPSNRLHVPLDDAPFAELVGHLEPIVSWVRGILEEAGVLDFAAGANASLGAHQQVPIRILIHCAHGISRSPAVGAALLVALPLIDAGEADLSEKMRETELDDPGRGMGKQDDDMEEDDVQMASPILPSSSKGESWISPLAQQCMSPASFSFLSPSPSPMYSLPDASTSTMTLASTPTPKPSPTPSPASTIRLRSPSRAARAGLPLFIPPSPNPSLPVPALEAKAEPARAPSPAMLSAALLSIGDAPPSSARPNSNSNTISSASLPLPLPSARRPTSPALPLPLPSSREHTVRRTLSAPAALAYVSARRPTADVNWGFRAQLNEWEGVCRKGKTL